jgi:hypothetical protein
MNKRATTYINVKLECVNGHPLGVYRIRQYDFLGPNNEFQNRSTPPGALPNIRCKVPGCGAPPRDPNEPKYPNA